MHGQDKMKYDTVYGVLVKRSEHADALAITNIIFKKLGLDKESTIDLQEILDLCERDIEFCSAFSRLYQHETL